MESVEESLNKFGHRMLEAYNLPKFLTLEKPENIVIAGVGGSGLSGSLFKMYFPKNVEVCKNYNIPEVNKNTLVIVHSYSGNTEEAVSCYKEAVRRGCATLSITSGGKLKQLCDENHTKFIRIPEGLWPRMALPYSFFAMLKALEVSGFVVSHEKEVLRAVEAVKGFPKERAKSLASKIGKKTPLIYATPKMNAVGYAWKTLINENAKKFAIFSEFPELTHNEIEAFGKLENPSDYCTILLHDEEDHPRNTQRVRVMKELLLDKGVKSAEILLRGRSYLARIFSALITGYWTSYYLALELEVDPDPINFIEGFKKKLGESDK